MSASEPPQPGPPTPGNNPKPQPASGCLGCFFIGVLFFVVVGMFGSGSGGSTYTEPRCGLCGAPASYLNGRVDERDRRNNRCKTCLKEAEDLKEAVKRLQYLDDLDRRKR